MKLGVFKNRITSALMASASAALLSGCAAYSAQAEDAVESASAAQTLPAPWANRPAAAEELYLERVRLIQGKDQFGYDVLADVPGADTPASALPAVQNTSISPVSIQAAVDYAETRNSLALLVWHNGQLVAERYFGEASADADLSSKSLSKPLTAVAVGRAIALEHIDGLDQKISEIIPEWQGTAKEGMTIRHALAMHSGLLEQGFDMSAESPFPRAYLDPYHGQYIVDEYPLTDQPGTRFAYSNAASDLIAVVIERATGREYEEFVGNEIFRKINAPGGKVWLNREGGLAHSGCCMEIPAQSWLKVGKLLMNDGMAGAERLLPEGYVAQMQQPSPDNEHYGLGVWLGNPHLERRGFLGVKSNPKGVRHSAAYLADDVFLFDGNGHQLTYIVPSEKLVILRMGSSPADRDDWDNAAIANAILGGIIRE